NLTAPKNTESSSTAKAAANAAVRPRKSRARGRVEHEVRPRARRASHERTGAVDVDSLYLAEMAASSILTPEQEVQLAERIIAAERSLIEALVRAPSGAQALCALATELGNGRVDIRTILLNPDQAGLDLGRTSEIVRGALSGSCAKDADLRGAVVDTLAGVRLDGDIIEAAIAAIRTGAPTSPEDAASVAAIEAARRELKRGKERLVVGNLRLVVLFARKYLGRGVPLLDLVQEGNLGLMRAADKFDHTRGFRFSTYAAWWIKQALQRALLDRTLRLPVHVADDRRRIGKVRASFITQHRREPTAEEISKLSGLAKERVQNILTLPAQPASLDMPMGEDGDATLGDLVAGNTALPDAEVSLRALGGHIETLMAALTPREQQVLRMRFGMGGAREHTLEEVGRALSLTRERIRQIERAALDKLRARESRVELRSYLET
ncbi:MAG: polymerase sigma factor RpoD, partial [Labilithrix sp.]|nr:polymerase sigma factor RpoD [Labilithrix sp.]